MHRSRFISDIPTNAIVPRDTIIQLPKSYLEGYFLKCLAARKRRTKPSRKRRKREGRRRRKKEERTYANWQLGITRKKLEQASRKIINIPPYRSPNISQQNACISTITLSPCSKIGHKETNFRVSRIIAGSWQVLPPRVRIV